MTKLTKSDDCADHPLASDADLYLAWNEMQWTMDGQVAETTISKESLCVVPEESHFLLLNCKTNNYLILNNNQSNIFSFV
jgi:hypothetical protein